MAVIYFCAEYLAPHTYEVGMLDTESENPSGVYRTIVSSVYESEDPHHKHGRHQDHYYSTDEYSELDADMVDFLLGRNKEDVYDIALITDEQYNEAWGILDDADSAFINIDQMEVLEPTSELHHLNQELQQYCEKFVEVVEGWNLF